LKKKNKLKTLFINIIIGNHSMSSVRKKKGRKPATEPITQLELQARQERCENWPFDLSLMVFPHVAELFENWSSELSCPLQWCFFSFLTVFSGMIGPSLYVQLLRGTWTEPIIMYTLNIGAPGSGKSPLYRKLHEALRVVENNLGMDPRRNKQIFLQGFTVEALAQTLSSNDRTILLYDEYLQLENKMDKDGQVTFVILSEPLLNH
jgi:hypothetical protein